MKQLLSFAFMSGLVLGAGDLTGPIAVLTDFENKPSEVSVSEMKKEVTRLMKDSGVEIDWRSQGSGPASNLRGISMRFRGKCQAGGPQAEISDLAPYGESVVLGSTKVLHGKVLPITEVGCDQIRKCLGFASGTNRLQRDMLLGQAMGRVVSHELFHILLNTRKHASKGVAKAMQDRRTLSSGDAVFTDEDLESLGSPKVRGSSGFVR